MQMCSLTSANLAQQIMKDRWMNVGHEEEELKPYTEPEPDFSDTKRIGLDLPWSLDHTLHSKNISFNALRLTRNLFQS